MNLEHLVVIAGALVAGIIAAAIWWATRDKTAPVTTETSRKHHTNLHGVYRDGRVLR